MVNLREEFRPLSYTRLSTFRDCGLERPSICGGGYRLMVLLLPSISDPRRQSTSSAAFKGCVVDVSWRCTFLSVRTKSYDSLSLAV